MCQEKEEEDLPALRIVSMQQSNDSRDIEKKKDRQITKEIQNEMISTELRREEKEFILREAQTNTMNTKSIKAKTNNTLKNGQCKFCGDRQTVNY